MFFLSSKTVRELREKVHDLERDFQRLSDEWDDMAALLRRRAGNAARQIQRLDEKEREVAGAEGNGQEQLPSLDPVSQRILARRKRITGQLPHGEVEQ